MVAEASQSDHVTVTLCLTNRSPNTCRAREGRVRGSADPPPLPQKFGAEVRKLHIYGDYENQRIALHEKNFLFLP